MVNDFSMTISTEDFLRILNTGVEQMVFSIGKLVAPDDKVVRVQYSRSSKRYTLVFTSGRKLKVIAADRKFVDDVIATAVKQPA